MQAQGGSGAASGPPGGLTSGSRGAAAGLRTRPLSPSTRRRKAQEILARQIMQWDAQSASVALVRGDNRSVLSGEAWWRENRRQAAANEIRRIRTADLTWENSLRGQFDESRIPVGNKFSGLVCLVNPSADAPKLRRLAQMPALRNPEDDLPDDLRALVLENRERVQARVARKLAARGKENFELEEPSDVDLDALGALGVSFDGEGAEAAAAAAAAGEAGRALPMGSSPSRGAGEQHAGPWSLRLGGDARMPVGAAAQKADLVAKTLRSPERAPALPPLAQGLPSQAGGRDTILEPVHFAPEVYEPVLEVSGLTAVMSYDSSKTGSNVATIFITNRGNCAVDLSILPRSSFNQEKFAAGRRRRASSAQSLCSSHTAITYQTSLTAFTARTAQTNRSAVGRSIATAASLQKALAAGPSTVDRLVTRVRAMPRSRSQNPGAGDDMTSMHSDSGAQLSALTGLYGTHGPSAGGARDGPEVLGPHTLQSYRDRSHVPREISGAASRCLAASSAGPSGSIVVGAARGSVLLGPGQRIEVRFVLPTGGDNRVRPGIILKEYTVVASPAVSVFFPTPEEASASASLIQTAPDGSATAMNVRCYGIAGDFLRLAQDTKTQARGGEAFMRDVYTRQCCADLVGELADKAVTLSRIAAYEKFRVILVKSEVKRQINEKAVEVYRSGLLSTAWLQHSSALKEFLLGLVSDAHGYQASVFDVLPGWDDAEYARVLRARLVCPREGAARGPAPGGDGVDSQSALPPASASALSPALSPALVACLRREAERDATTPGQEAGDPGSVARRQTLDLASGAIPPPADYSHIDISGTASSIPDPEGINCVVSRYSLEVPPLSYLALLRNSPWALKLAAYRRPAMRAHVSEQALGMLDPFRAASVALIQQAVVGTGGRGEGQAQLPELQSAQELEAMVFRYGLSRGAMFLALHAALCPPPLALALLEALGRAVEQSACAQCAVVQALGAPPGPGQAGAAVRRGAGNTLLVPHHPGWGWDLSALYAMAASAGVRDPLLDVLGEGEGEGEGEEEREGAEAPGAAGEAGAVRAAGAPDTPSAPNAPGAAAPAADPEAGPEGAEGTPALPRDAREALVLIRHTLLQKHRCGYGGFIPALAAAVAGAVDARRAVLGFRGYAEGPAPPLRVSSPKAVLDVVLDRLRRVSATVEDERREAAAQAAAAAKERKPAGKAGQAAQGAQSAQEAALEPEDAPGRPEEPKSPMSALLEHADCLAPEISAKAFPYVVRELVGDLAALIEREARYCRTVPLQLFLAASYQRRNPNHADPYRVGLEYPPNPAGPRSLLPSLGRNGSELDEASRHFLALRGYYLRALSLDIAALPLLSPDQPAPEPASAAKAKTQKPKAPAQAADHGAAAQAIVVSPALTEPLSHFSARDAAPAGSFPELFASLYAEAAEASAAAAKAEPDRRGSAGGQRAAKPSGKAPQVVETTQLHLALPRTFAGVYFAETCPWALGSRVFSAEFLESRWADVQRILGEAPQHKLDFDLYDAQRCLRLFLQAQPVGKLSLNEALMDAVSAATQLSALPPTPEVALAHAHLRGREEIAGAVARRVREAEEIRARLFGMLAEMIAIIYVHAETGAPQQAAKPAQKKKEAEVDEFSGPRAQEAREAALAWLEGSYGTSAVYLPLGDLLDLGDYEPRAGPVGESEGEPEGETAGGAAGTDGEAPAGEISEEPRLEPGALLGASEPPAAPSASASAPAQAQAQSKSHPKTAAGQRKAAAEASAAPAADPGQADAVDPELAAKEAAREEERRRDRLPTAESAFSEELVHKLRLECFRREFDSFIDAIFTPAAEELVGEHQNSLQLYNDSMDEYSLQYQKLVAVRDGELTAEEAGIEEGQEMDPEALQAPERPSPLGYQAVRGAEREVERVSRREMNFCGIMHSLPFRKTSAEYLCDELMLSLAQALDALRGLYRAEAPEEYVAQRYDEQISEALLSVGLGVGMSEEEVRALEARVSTRLGQGAEGEGGAEDAQSGQGGQDAEAAQAGQAVPPAQAAQPAQGAPAGGADPHAQAPAKAQDTPAEGETSQSSSQAPSAPASAPADLRAPTCRVINKAGLERLLGIFGVQLEADPLIRPLASTLPSAEGAQAGGQAGAQADAQAGAQPGAQQGQRASAGAGAASDASATAAATAAAGQAAPAPAERLPDLAALASLPAPARSVLDPAVLASDVVLLRPSPLDGVRAYLHTHTGVKDQRFPVHAILTAPGALLGGAAADDLLGEAGGLSAGIVPLTEQAVHAVAAALGLKPPHTEAAKDAKRGQKGKGERAGKTEKPEKARATEEPEAPPPPPEEAPEEGEEELGEEAEISLYQLPVEVPTEARREVWSLFFDRALDRASLWFSACEAAPALLRRALNYSARGLEGFVDAETEPV